MFRKTLVLFLIITVITSVSAAVFAAPEVIDAEYEGDVYDIISITGPESEALNTFERSCLVSGYGQEGAVVTFYIYNRNDEVYYKMYGEEEEAVSLIVGSSSQFMKNIDLQHGRNRILLLAEYGGGEEDGEVLTQAVKINIRVMNYNLFNIIQNLFQ